MGSGVQIATDCSEDKLDKNWQRLILTHLAEKEHKGVLTGAGLTDVNIPRAEISVRRLIVPFARD